LRARARSRTDLKGRRDDIDAALKLEPTSPYALQALADLLYTTAQYDEETTALSKILDQPKSDQVTLLSQRGVAYNKSGRPELAERDVQAALHAAKTAEDFNTICWKLATGDTFLAEALSICDKAIALDPKNGASADSRAFVLLRLARYQEAIAQYTKALELKPSQAASFYGRGIAKRRSGDQKAGDRDLDAARKLDASVDDEFSEYGVTP
jgi:tetratricopeptide (TPR) repeat protein